MVLLKNLHPPTEGVRHEQAETTAVMDGQKLGCGTLYVAETRLSWFDGSGMGFSLEYPSIGLHAISRDVSAYPQEHLYVMVNGKLNDDNEAEMAEKAGDEDDSSISHGDGDDDDDDDGDEGTITEIRFVPSDRAALDSMFSAMCECQALHPDPEDADSDNDFEGEEYDVEEAEAEHGHQADIPTFYTCDEGLSALTQEGQATLERLEGMLAESVAQQYHMAGVRTGEANNEFEDGMEVDAAAMEAGQFEDADVEHCVDIIRRCTRIALGVHSYDELLPPHHRPAEIWRISTLSNSTSRQKSLQRENQSTSTTSAEWRGGQQHFFQTFSSY